MQLSQWIVKLSQLSSFHSDLYSSIDSGSKSAWHAVSQATSCCDALQKICGDLLHYPNSDNYTLSTGSYWSLKNVEVHPSCIVQPQSSIHVSQVVQVLTLGAEKFPNQCQFAIRSGGHTPFKEAATVEQGVVIDLSNMPSAGLSEDMKTMTVSPARKWDDLYDELGPYNKTVIGGRVAGVGVGGLITGCGISYLSARYGFACNHVENFEAVLATGDIVNANAFDNPDLWKALRGGSNNYAIVTSITLKTYPQGLFWGGQTFHGIDSRTEIFQAMEDLIHNYDPYAHFISTFVITGQMRSWFTANGYHYSDSDPQEFALDEPTLFKKLLDIKRTPVFPGTPDNTLRVDSVGNYSREYKAALSDQKRWTFASISFGNSAEMMEEFWEMADQMIKPFLGVDGLLLSLSFQPMPTMITERSRAVDILGPIQTQGNMFNVHFALGIDDEAMHNDSVVREAIRKLFNDAEVKAAKLGLQRDFIPLTYADSWQEPIKRRSKMTVKEMIATSRKYDPRAVFQNQVPGGFKLPLA